MKITFSDNTEGVFELTHQYESDMQPHIDNYVEAKQKYQETVRFITAAGYEAEAKELIEWYQQEICLLKGDITILKQKPIKTHASFTYNGSTTKAFSSISREDERKKLHCRKKGRSAAIKNLLSALAANGHLDKGKRTELATRLLPQMK